MNNLTFSEVCSAIGHESRREILELLGRRKSGIIVGRISQLLRIEPSTLSFHLSVLTKAQLVEYRRRGNKITYTLNSKNIRYAGHRLMKLAG